MSNGQRQEGRGRRPVVARFAGEAFAHFSNPKDGPLLRKLASTVAWKNPPQSTVRAEVSR